MLTVTDRLLEKLAGFTGTLLLPGDPGYEHARGVFNALVDKRPALIARCSGVADVAAAVDFARERGLEVSVRGGGHDVAGTAVTEGGVMIDLSQMRGVRVDAEARIARVQGGVTWGELTRETQMHGLAVTGGIVSSTGIGGTALGGGLGWLMGKHGLTVDSLVSAEVVTADGSVLEASTSEHDDLFWALRGGGGNFGVVSSFELRLHPVGPEVTGGIVVHPYEAARDLLRLYAKVAAGAPDELGLCAMLSTARDGSGEKVAALAVCHVGSRRQAGRDLAPLLAFGSAIRTEIGPVPYTLLGSLFDAAYAPGLRHHWKSSFLGELPDDAVDAVVEAFGPCPSSLSSVLIQHVHGAVARVPVDATACPHRVAGHSVLAASVWREHEATEANTAWARETIAAFASSGGPGWVGHLDADDAGGAAAREVYGPNYDRLGRIKRTYDPSNFFHLNVNIEPTKAGGRDG